MKDLQQMYIDCLRELAAIGIRPQKITAVTVNTRAKNRWGQAKRTGDTFEISISDRLLGDDLPDEPLRDTMIHEILHCVKGCHGHTGKWAQLVNKCNQQLGTNIRTVISYDGVIPSVPAKYVIRCMSCGTSYERQKMSRLVQHPEDYHCRCGGILKRIR
jgi:predicted SprT family Zn-dependent metalloprotease